MDLLVIWLMIWLVWLVWLVCSVIVFARLACSTDSVLVVILRFTRPAGRPAVPSESGKVTIDLMTQPQTSKIVSSDVQKPVVGEWTQRSF